MISHNFLTCLDKAAPRALCASKMVKLVISHCSYNSKCKEIMIHTKYISDNLVHFVGHQRGRKTTEIVFDDLEHIFLKARIAGEILIYLVWPCIWKVSVNLKEQNNEC